MLWSVFFALLRVILKLPTKKVQKKISFINTRFQPVVIINKKNQAEFSKKRHKAIAELKICRIFAPH
jgi:hypothetical protein